MKKLCTFLVVALTVLAGCGSSAKQKQELQQAKNNPQYQKDVARAEKEVSGCFSKNFNLANKQVRQKFYLCVGHGRDPQKTEACVAKVIGQDLPLHHKRFVQDTAQECVLR